MTQEKKGYILLFAFLATAFILGMTAGIATKSNTYDCPYDINLECSNDQTIERIECIAYCF